MKTISVPLSKITINPWRDLALFPIDKNHVAALKDSIDKHGFFGGIKARPVDGLFEPGCGIHRLRAAAEAGLTSVEIQVGPMTDDEMLDLMVAENATQAGGSNAAAILNDIAAVTRRLIDILLGGKREIEHFREVSRKYPGLFEDRQAFDTARGKLLARLNDPDKPGGVGRDLVLRYLSLGGKPSPHPKQQIHDGIAVLKESGKYDTLVDEALARFKTAEFTESSAKIPAKRRDVQPAKNPTRRKRTFDERCAQVFTNSGQLNAFKDAVSTEAAKRFIPVDQQYGIAKTITANMGKEAEGSFRKKHLGAPFIKAHVSAIVREATKAQRDIDEQERQRLYREQRDEEIKSEIKMAQASARSLTSTLIKLIALAKEFPGHRYLGDLGGKLGPLAKLIEDYRKLTNY